MVENTQTQKLEQIVERLQEVSEMKLGRWRERFYQWSDIFRMLTGASVWPPLIGIYRFGDDYRVALLTPRNEILLLTKKIGDAITIKEIVEKMRNKIDEIINNFIEDLSEFAEDFAEEIAKINDP